MSSSESDPLTSLSLLLAELTVSGSREGGQNEGQNAENQEEVGPQLLEKLRPILQKIGEQANRMEREQVSGTVTIIETLIVHVYHGYQLINIQSSQVVVLMLAPHVVL